MSVPSGISTRRADDRQLLRLLVRSPALVPPLQEELKQVPKKLERDILECKGGPVEELKHVGGVGEFLERGDLGMAESTVGFFDKLPQLGLGNLVGGDI